MATPASRPPTPTETVDHAERYVDGQLHTNGLENFWSLLKRGLHGTYISVRLRDLRELACQLSEPLELGLIGWR